MSGRRPDTTRVWNFQNHFRETGVGEDWLSLPEYFKSHGMLTMGSGKLFHPGVPPDNDWPKSWSTDQRYYSPECMPPHCPHSVPPRADEHEDCGNSSSVYCTKGASGLFSCIAEDPIGAYTVCAANTSKEESRFEYQLEDQRIRDSCLDQLGVAAKGLASGAKGAAKGFFIGCGFHKPHVPFVFPAEFLQHFPTDLADVPLADDTYAPVDMPDPAWHFPADVHGFPIKFNGTCNETRSRNFRRGYYAAVAYTDYNIGGLLDRVDQLGLTATTAVVVFGDHGWQLGEHDTWAKMTNFEVALRTPLVIRAPWKTASIGKVTSVLAEAVDFYPTLAALVGLPPPQSAGQRINGTSLLPAFDDPDGAWDLKPAAYSQFAKPSREAPFEFWPTPARNETEIMGYSVRTDQWRYTCWFGFDGATVTPNRDEILGRELYDHRGDPGELDWRGEHVNLAGKQEHSATVASLHKMALDYIQLYPVGRARMIHKSGVVCNFESELLFCL